MAEKLSVIVKKAKVLKRATATALKYNGLLSLEEDGVKKGRKGECTNGGTGARRAGELTNAFTIVHSLHASLGK